MGEESKITDEELDAAIGGIIEGDDGDGDDGGDADGNVNDGATGDGNDADGGGDTGDGGGNEINWEKELNDTKSSFGRKQKHMEDQITGLTENVNRLIEALSNKQTDSDEHDDYDSDDPIPLTMGGFEDTLKKLLNKNKKSSDNDTNKYQDGYMGRIEKLGSDYTDPIHQHIVDRMFKEFNIRHSDNPLLDAELNFRNAEAAILREVRSRKTNPLDKNKGKNNKNLGGANSSDQDANLETPVKLDSYAAEFVKASGMSEADAQKALVGDMPMYLRGKV